ncbi:hypothetical protein MTO96_022238 [Rhipicephalus appendiculatus]
MFRITAALSSARQLRWVPLRSLLNTQCHTATSEVPVAEREVRELQIPVPHGHLAAKQWLPTSAEDPGRRVLLLHGYLDNAGSFDPPCAMARPSMAHRGPRLNRPRPVFTFAQWDTIYFNAVLA